MSSSISLLPIHSPLLSRAPCDLVLEPTTREGSVGSLNFLISRSCVQAKYSYLPDRDHGRVTSSFWLEYPACAFILGHINSMGSSGWNRALVNQCDKPKSLKSSFIHFHWMTAVCRYTYIFLQERQQLTKTSPFNIIKLFYCTYWEVLTSVAWTNCCSNYVSIHPA